MKKPAGGRITFRMPKKLKERVRLLAVQERRSMNTQLVVLVERGMAE